MRVTKTLCITILKNCLNDCFTTSSTEHSFRFCKKKIFLEFSKIVNTKDFQVKVFFNTIKMNGYNVVFWQLVPKLEYITANTLFWYLIQKLLDK